MKNLIIMILMAVAFTSCAKSDREVNCKVFMKFDVDGHRVNAFGDVDRGYEVDVQQCTTIYAVGEEPK